MMQTLPLVALGGAIGAAVRHVTTATALRLFGAGLPVGTLFVNVAGSLLMGLLFVALTERGAGRLSPFVLTGILGGFTTFSAFSLDTLQLVERGQSLSAATYVAASVILSLLAVFVGVILARGLLA